jgi:hypothetical protein
VRRAAEWLVARVAWPGTGVAWPGARPLLPRRHSLLRLPGVRRAERLLPVLSRIELRLPVLPLGVLPVAERLLPVLSLIELCLLGKRCLLTRIRLAEGGIAELYLRAGLGLPERCSVVGRLWSEGRLACLRLPEWDVSELWLLGEFRLGEPGLGKVALLASVRLAEPGLAEPRAELGLAELALLASVRLAGCGVGMRPLLAERGLWRERGVSELSLTKGRLAKLRVRAEWRLLARLRLAAPVLGELWLLARLRLAERCRTELRV